VFKHSADRWPVFFILCLSALDFAFYFLVSNVYVLGAYFFLMILPKAQICAWNHHHQHAPTFKTLVPNRMMEFFYALHTGVTTNLWVLHHNYGHHNNFLDQSKDESRWTRYDGTQMKELEYSLLITVTAYYRGYIVGKEHPKEQRTFIVYTLITFAFVTGLVAYQPAAGLLLFVLPMIVGLFITAWTTYDHHAGLNTENEFEASFNNVNRWYNLFTGNLGYHTAHHYKQGLHWSKLPQLHDKIKDNIPEKLIQRTWI